MALTTVPNDFVIYNDWLHSGYLERIAENVEGFNANSNSAIILTTESLLGNYRETSFFKELAQSDLIHDRDKNDLTSVTSAKMLAVETVVPYLPSRFGPYETTLSAFNDIGESPERFSELLGQALADAVMKDMLDVSFKAIIGATQGIAGETMTVGAGAAGTAALTYEGFIDGMAAWGDKLDEVACFVMRSKDYYGVMKGNITAATIDSIAGATLNAGTVATMGKPVLVMDNASLVAKGLADGDSGCVLALTTSAITCIADDNMVIKTEDVLGQANLIIKWQGESQFGIKLKGFGFDKTKTIDRTTLAVGANWAQKVTSTKNLGAAVIITAL